MQSNYDKPFTNKEKLQLFGSFSFLISLGLIACLFFLTCFVNNTQYGIEVSANGFNLALATLLGKFKSRSDIFGDISVPFYYYSKSITIVLGVLSLITLFAIIVLVVTTYMAISKKTVKFAKTNMIGSFVIAGLFFLTFVIALILNAGDILKIYCGGNPKCSIGSLSIIPAALAAGNGILNYFYGKKIVEYGPLEE